MRKIRFLIMMAAMLLSCGIANAQGSEATDGQTTTLKGDLNEDGRVNAADVTVLVGIIMNTDYFLLGTDTEMPNRSNYTTIGGVVTTYKSIDDVLKAAPKVSLKADQRGTLLCPESWDVTDLVLQNEGDGASYALNAADTDISGYNLFQTEKVADEAEYVLKTKAEAEAYKISITDFFYLGTEEPTKDNYTTIEGVVTNYKNFPEVLEAAPTIKVTAGKAANLLCPSSWNADMVVFVFQNEEDGTIYNTGKVETDISEYTLFRTEVMAEEVTLKLKLKLDAEAYEESLHPNVPQYFWLGNTFPTENNFPTLGGKEVDGISTTYTSLGEAMEKASRNYTAGEQAVVLYPKSWGNPESLGISDELVFLDSANKQYYATKQKSPSDFPDYYYYETLEKIGANTTIKLSTKKTAEDAGATLYVKPADSGTGTGTGTGTDPGTGTGTVTPPVDNPVVVPGQAVYTGGNGIKFVITNNTGVEARFSGKVILNVSRNPNDWANSTQVNANMHGPTSGTSWAYNDIIIPAGQSYTSPEITTIDGIYMSGVNFTDGSWYLMNSDNGVYVHAFYLYTRIWNTRKNESSGSNHMYVATPLQNTKLLRGYTYYLNLHWKNPEATIDPIKTGHYVILGYGKTHL